MENAHKRAQKSSGQCCNFTHGLRIRSMLPLYWLSCKARQEVLRMQLVSTVHERWKGEVAWPCSTGKLLFARNGPFYLMMSLVWRPTLYSFIICLFYSLFDKSTKSLTFLPQGGRFWLLRSQFTGSQKLFKRCGRVQFGTTKNKSSRWQKTRDSTCNLFLPI